MKKVIKLTESELINVIKRIISEQTTPGSPTLLSIPLSNLSFKAVNMGKIIKLSGIVNGKEQVLNYKVEGSFGPFDFDVELMGLHRTSSGDLDGYAKPSGYFTSKLLALIPKEYKKVINLETWVRIGIPKKDLQKGIDQLKNTKGKTTEIEAGNGVTLKLSLA